MGRPFRLIVTDKAPLFTLVLADALDMLPQPNTVPPAVNEAATWTGSAAVERTNIFLKKSTKKLLVRCRALIG